MEEAHHVRTFFDHQQEQDRLRYQIRLDASIDYVRFLLCQALPFRTHDEPDSSSNQGNFRELLGYTAEHNESIKSEVLENAPGNLKLYSLDIQKDIVSAATIETIGAIHEDIGDSLFAVMVDESKDVSIREQMAVVIRYVNKKGCVIERVIGIIHVLQMTAISLKIAVDQLFSKYGLNIMRLRGQCYDGASNMQGPTNGLQALILRENSSSYVVHCFAHQLQLALIHVAQKHNEVALHFSVVGQAVNIVSGSCKRRDILQEKEFARVVELVEKGERLTGSGLNQETCLKRVAGTRRVTHYNTLLSLIHMFPSVLDLLDINALEITNELSQALQRKDQDIINVMNLVRISKNQLQTMRDNGWDRLILDVSTFCAENDIEIFVMTYPYVLAGRSRRNAFQETNLHHYQVGLFNSVVDMQISALNDRFNEVNTELLLCMSCLNPREKFSAFDKGALFCLAKLYPLDFSAIDLMVLERQLDTFITDVLSRSGFSKLNGISSLAQKMVETKRDKVYHHVYLLITLSLILPVATATVERVFSVMKIVKNRLRNRIGDEWLNNCLLTYIEREIFCKIGNDKIRARFQGMSTRRGRC